ncbi:putative metallopeptidase [Selenomonas ruminantium subsp. lactilytica TAM6421]|uniref:Putative metallopeptidase n=1 Tax=Selenomonas ruminantium subsp. lactilytica (strain NBRC 103574 / TAM6421) TaxID=927704 RepID=I0GR29_SELRL|nr:insulinase family protein [Selenomonas ruminantium]BAL83216.1 putative metallopeptidase [Selenomonas ruminantium subsp. lactilytica TAM6421]
MKVNDHIHGFNVINRSESKETNSVAWTFEHEKSGARLFFLQNDDDNKVFSISFRTPPFDDTGVAHIVEHSTLCGSRKYPLKEPFVELVKGSLNTFLNAMTYPDKTMYPVASRNDKDFQNLMDVYLDAVFYPNMLENPQILMQEGWHYEIDDAQAPLTYSGVVYNEMKGALSAPDDLLESRVMAALYPDNTYGYESGGDPEAIPQLTYEMFKNFHQRYYHPANSYIYLYGDMDIEEKLAYLNKEYLSHFDRITLDSHIEKQQAFTGLKRQDLHYPASPDEDTAEKSFLSLSWVVGESLNLTDMMGLEILEHALLRTPAAPLRKALIDAQLGKDVDSSFEEDILQPFFSIIISNSEADRADKFYNIVRETLQKLAEEGIDRTLLEASINLLEFRLRESDFGSAPKGLIYGIRIMKTWLYDGEPEKVLAYEPIIKAMKDGLQNGYFEDLIRRYFLNNTHAALLTMSPDKKMAAEREQKQADMLAERKKSMSAAEIEQLIEENKALKKRQQSEDSEEALKTIPLLKLSDIRRKAYELPLEEKDLAGTKVLFSDIETNGIVYLSLLFDAQVVPQEDIAYAFLLSELIGNVDTEQSTYAELANRKNLHTGGITYDMVTYTRNNEPDSNTPKFKIKAKVLREKLPQLLELLQEILMTSKFSDEKRIRELLEQEQATIELNLQRSAHQVVSARLAGYLTPAGRYADEGGLPFYPFIKELLAGFPANLPAIAAKLSELAQKIFNQHNLIVSVTDGAPYYDGFAAEFDKFQQELGQEIYPAQEYHWDLQALNEGLTSSSRVQYVGKGANFLKLGHKFTGTMHVLETILRYDYFWTKIRVQGGAYGAFTSFNRNGMMYFGSYRDPNLTETLDVFNGTADYLRNFAASEREMDKYIIGTMSNIDTPLTPQMKGSAAATCWLRGITEADRQKSRDEILDTRQADVQKLSQLVEDCMKKNVLCVFGGQEKINAHKEVFGEVRPAL